MHVVAYACMVFGAILALTGIVLFVKMGTQGTSSVKMFGFEFQLGGSALVIFVVGTLLFIIPVIYADRLLEHNKSDDRRDITPIPSRGPSETEKPISSRDPPETTKPMAFVILDEGGEIKVEEGLFSTLDECSVQLKVLRDSDDPLETASRCDAAPSKLFCLSYFGDKDEYWVCYLNGSECFAGILFHEKFSRNVNTRCERMTFAEALQKLR